MLKPGQCLVSREGDLWRWDGLSHAAEAPTPAIRRLAEKNRLQDLLREGTQARAAADEAAAAAQATGVEVERLTAENNLARDAYRTARASLEEVRERHSAAERRRAQVAARLAALEEAKSRLAVDRDEFRRRRDEAEAALSGTNISQALAADLDRARAAAGEARAQASEARAALDALRRDAQAREARPGTRGGSARARKSASSKRAAPRRRASSAILPKHPTISCSNAARFSRRRKKPRRRARPPPTRSPRAKPRSRTPIVRPAPRSKR